MLNFLFRRPRRDGKVTDNVQPMWKLLDHSPIPAIVILVLVWATIGVTLTLSALRLRDPALWQLDGKAPFSLYALTGFSYEDSAATARARQQAAAQTPECFSRSRERTDLIIARFKEFQGALKVKEDTIKSGRKFVDNTPLGQQVAAFTTYGEFLTALRHDDTGVKFHEELRKILEHGVIGGEMQRLVRKDMPVRVYFSKNGFRDELIPGPQEAMARLIAAIEKIEKAKKLTAKCRSELAAVSLELFRDGNLILNPEAKSEEVRTAMAQVKPVVRHLEKGELIINRNATVTQREIDILAAEKQHLPQGTGVKIFYYRMLISLLLLLSVVSLMFFIYPEFIRKSRNIVMSGALLMVSLLANYYGLKLFYHLFQHGTISSYHYMAVLVPINMGAALFGVLLNRRAAMFNIWLVSIVMSLMVIGENTLALAIRWFFCGAIVILVVGSVRNYRSFCIRVLLAGLLATLLCFGDVLLQQDISQTIRFLHWALLNNLACATGSLLLVFLFEVLFNIDTTMSLMVLCDYNHPLLEKLKREAPGTMFHSITVATLAEDAAKVLRLDSLKVKAGALFHDIGKLASPRHFVENNSQSPQEYEKMPPQRCSAIIRGHVVEGLKLAEEYRLSGFLREAIASHHGDDLVSFFYRRALEEAEKDPSAPRVREEDFHYGGPVPEEKELTIISLADACEAACRSLGRPSPEEISKMVEKIFISRLSSGQLRNSKLTLQELQLIKQSFINNLISFHHGRVEYKK